MQSGCVAKTLNGCCLSSIKGGPYHSGWRTECKRSANGCASPRRCRRYGSGHEGCTCPSARSSEARCRGTDHENQALRSATREIPRRRFILLFRCFSARARPCRTPSFDATFPGPLAGSRILHHFPRMEDYPVGRMKVRTLLQKIGVKAMDRQPDLSRRHDACLIEWMARLAASGYLGAE